MTKTIKWSIFGIFLAGCPTVGRPSLGRSVNRIVRLWLLIIIKIWKLCIIMYTDKFLADSYKQNLQSSTHAEYSLTILVKCEHWFWDWKPFLNFLLQEGKDVWPIYWVVGVPLIGCNLSQFPMITASYANHHLQSAYLRVRLGMEVRGNLAKLRALM